MIYRVKLLLRKSTYLFIHKVGVHYFANDNGTVDWDEISLGTLLDVLIWDGGK